VPTYQYSCTECGHFFEQVQSFSDDALTTCPECAGRLRKVFNAVGVVFKGSGFYRTDSRTSTGKEAGASSGGGTGKDGDGASTGAAASGAGAGASSTKDTSSSGSASTTGSSGAKSTTSGSAA
jgi:putative FmdB family regulatory protein